jgi:glutamate 5-kinase
MTRLGLKKVRRLVLKIGSSIIASSSRGLNETRMKEIALQVASLRSCGLEVLIVSSGAIICGMEKLGLTERPRSIPLKQAAAAVGQGRLMWAYEKTFSPFDIQVAQILLTQEDLDDRKRFLNSRNTLTTLLERRILPIINENDTVAVEEIRFGDNDSLAALVVHLIDAQLLVIFSDVDGLFTEDPRANPGAALIPEVAEVDERVERLAAGSTTVEGTGGMASKVRTAKKVAAYGVPTLILNGTLPDNLTRALAGEAIGTYFLPRPTRLSSRKHWIAHTLKPKGKLTLDRGAVEAVASKGKSLLPSGIVRVEGRFEAGDAVLCLSPEGTEVARGLCNYSSQETARILGARSAEIEKRLGYKLTDEVIHRDNLVLIGAEAEEGPRTGNEK